MYSILLVVAIGQPALPPPVPVQGKERLYSPADVSRACENDAIALSKILPQEEMNAVRYLSLANIPKDQRKKTAGRVNMLLNSLSRKRAISQLFLGGLDDVFIRVNLNDYGIDPTEYFKLAEKDPYFHEKVQVVIDTNGKTKTANAAAVWLDSKAMVNLITLTGSETPILRADWFFINASLPPHYYDLLGLKKLEDVKELALFDKRAEALTLAKATVVFSGGKATKVARNNRILFRVSTATGAWWQTLDYTESIGEKNVINNFLNEKFDGGEIIFTLPNGLQGYFLINDKSERVDEVPIAIAIDELAHDKRVRTGRSCIVCHSKGIQPFVSDFKLQVGPGKADLAISDIKLARRIRETFGDPDFDLLIKADNERYEFSIKASSGDTAATNASNFNQMYNDYAETGVDAEKMILETGVSDVRVKLAASVRDGNGVLLRRLVDLPIRRDHFEESYGSLMRAILATTGKVP